MDLFSEFKRTNDWKPFDRYHVKLHITDLVGGVPKNAELIDGWIKATCKEANDEQRAAIVQATKETLTEAAEEMVDKQSIGFKSDERGLFIEGRHVKAMLKECGNIIKDLVEGFGKKGDSQKGISNFKSKVAEQLFVEEERIYLGKQKPDEIEERPIHVMTAQGPRNSLKRVEIVRDVDVGFTLCRRKGNIVPEKAMLAILDYAQTNGLGADRSQGRGKFRVVSVEKIEVAEVVA